MKGKACSRFSQEVSAFFHPPQMTLHVSLLFCESLESLQPSPESPKHPPLLLQSFLTFEVS